jgi:hypothetical protein
MTNDQTLTIEMPVRVLLAGPDTLYFSCDLPISEAMRDRLNQEKVTAQALADERRVQMLLGVFSAKGVLPLEFKPAHSVWRSPDATSRRVGTRGGTQRWGRTDPRRALRQSVRGE